MLSLGSFPALVPGQCTVDWATALAAGVAAAQTGSVDLGYFDTIVGTGHIVQPPLVLVGTRTLLLDTSATAMPFAVVGILLFVATPVVAAAFR